MLKEKRLKRLGIPAASQNGETEEHTSPKNTGKNIVFNALNDLQLHQNDTETRASPGHIPKKLVNQLRLVPKCGIKKTTELSRKNNPKGANLSLNRKKKDLNVLGKNKPQDKRSSKETVHVDEEVSFKVFSKQQPTKSGNK